MSFDGVSVSGVIVELFKLAKIFHTDYNCDVYLDLGYDIKPDKNKFLSREEDRSIPYFKPPWLKMDELTGLSNAPHYNASFIQDVLLEKYISRDIPMPEEIQARVERSSDYIANLLVSKWQSLNIQFVIVENGTLPDNIIYTKALYKAIDRYGELNNFNKFVLWRDHDLMWNSETEIKKYGSAPYINTVKPKFSKHITYVALHQEAYERTLEWAPDIDIFVLNNFFIMDRLHSIANTRIGSTKTSPTSYFRDKYNIPPNDYVMCRCTRLIPQKRLDREVYLISELNKLFESNSSEQKAYLLIATDVEEDVNTYTALVNYIDELGVQAYVKFVGSLSPFNHGENLSYDNQSVYSLMRESDLVSFLTAKDYESYGNPIGEAVSVGRLCISTHYDFYDYAYGQYGLNVPLFDSEISDLPYRSFVESVYEILTNRDKRSTLEQYNLKIAAQHFCCRHISKMLSNYFPDLCNDELDINLMLNVEPVDSVAYQ